MRVTVLSGFLGAGKTTLLKHLLGALQRDKEGATHQNLRLALIVNDMASMNVDAELIKSGAIAQLGDAPELVEMQNGCICCTLRMDLLRTLTILARSSKYDHCIIESTGISEPMQVAETFMLMRQVARGDEDAQEAIEEAGNAELKDMVLADHPEDRLAHLAQLDACVTVIDALNFLDTFEDSRVVADVEARRDFRDDERSLTDLMVDQVEFADVIVLNKTDLVSSATLAKIEAVIAQLNPGAILMPTTFSCVDPAAILNTGAFSFAKAMTHAGWLQSLRGEVVPETEEYGVSSFVYRRRRPFHPQRLHDLLTSAFILYEGKGRQSLREPDQGETHSAPSHDTRVAVAKARKRDTVFADVLRSKGFIWLATRPTLMGEWSQAGLMITIQGRGPWLRDLPQDVLALLEEDKVKQDLGESNDDRRQEIVFIGAPLRHERVEQALDACLVTETEWVRLEQQQQQQQQQALANHSGKGGLLEAQQHLMDPFIEWHVSGSGEDEEESADDDNDDDAVARSGCDHERQSSSAMHACEDDDDDDDDDDVDDGDSDESFGFG